MKVLLIISFIISSCNDRPPNDSTTDTIQPAIVPESTVVEKGKPKNYDSLRTVSDTTGFWREYKRSH